MENSRPSLREQGRYAFIPFIVIILCGEVEYMYLLLLPCRSMTMMSLVDYARTGASFERIESFERKVKEAEDVKGEEDEVIVLRRTISKLNAQRAVNARDNVEALEQKDREILNLNNEITNLHQTLSSERLARKKVEERVEALEEEVHKLRRLALAYKTKLVKGNLTSSMDLKQLQADGTPDINIITPRLEITPSDHSLGSNSGTKGSLVTSLSASSVPDLHRLDLQSLQSMQFLAPTAPPPHARKALSDLNLPTRAVQLDIHIFIEIILSSKISFDSVYLILTLQTTPSKLNLPHNLNKKILPLPFRPTILLLPHDLQQQQQTHHNNRHTINFHSIKLHPNQQSNFQLILQSRISQSPLESHLLLPLHFLPLPAPSPPHLLLPNHLLLIRTLLLLSYLPIPMPFLIRHQQMAMLILPLRSLP